ncbi:restriction endonuclease subunit S [Microbacterium sp. H37-C3]|uniref:restriction endonuclease subunit S n=1 Tax=Microbacterium sp. H37-C3 TaxID=3004354 RepID=UPI0022B03752|nr:restriction endonuclease subunit S [Microbacterium sp. H37-C3]MCZ4069005.1 restriction endonuclease subunit S [Microbacterium sp. H37-C3]
MTFPRIPLRRAARILNGGTPPSGVAEFWDGDVPFVTPPDLNGLDGAQLESTARTITAEGVAHSGLAPAGSVLLSTRAPIGHIGRLTSPAAFNQGCRALVPARNHEARFLAYALVASRADMEARGLGTTFLELSGSSLAQVGVPLAPLDEQRAIADFLDRETAQIDAFIAKNEELITLLTERRAAVTAQAVTRGIDDSAVLKESGLGWLGSIPEDWEAVRVKFAVRSLPGFAFASGDFVADSGATRLLRGINVGVGSISWGETVGIENPPAYVESRYMLDEGDLVLGMDRPVISGGLRVARVGQRDAGTLLVQRVLRLRGALVRNDYLEYSLAWGGFAMYIEPDFTGVSVPHMSEQQVGNFTIALPDLSTQARIVEYIRDQHSAIDAALDAARRSIDLMRERRAALISAAVTGKIDVGVAA